ncbi:hypothetical protein [Vibrio sinaloensis]|uniref:Uncharacterized protein n=1 Tax=Photobacterium sp. (strain ATCC 43367) TaxID=379097 RepID=A0A0A5JQV1_PHOS4|nr:hypothetical protein [Vibrio sinaloensis]KGY10353.1 hypothetical protein NM06_05450 [Vibrio sinaloensis]
MQPLVMSVLVGSRGDCTLEVSTNHEDDAMNINYVASVTTEILLITIAQNEGLLTIEDAWQLEGEYYQQFGDALEIGKPGHESTKLELHLLSTVPTLLCCLTILYLSRPDLTRADLRVLVQNQICSLVYALYKKRGGKWFI